MRKMVQRVQLAHFVGAIPFTSAPNGGLNGLPLARLVQLKDHPEGRQLLKPKRDFVGPVGLYLIAWLLGSLVGCFLAFLISCLLFLAGFSDCLVLFACLVVWLLGCFFSFACFVGWLVGGLLSGWAGLLVGCWLAHSLACSITQGFRSCVLLSLVKEHVAACSLARSLDGPSMCEAIRWICRTALRRAREMPWLAPHGTISSFPGRQGCGLKVVKLLLYIDILFSAHALGLKGYARGQGINASSGVKEWNDFTLGVMAGVSALVTGLCVCDQIVMTPFSTPE